jgi:hypothetical protein
MRLVPILAKRETSVMISSSLGETGLALPPFPSFLAVRIWCPLMRSLRAVFMRGLRSACFFKS